MRRDRGVADGLAARPRVHAGADFDTSEDSNTSYDSNTRSIPSLSGPMSPDGLHRSSDADPPNAYPQSAAFGPYGRHQVEPAFDDPLGPVLPEWPDDPEDTGNDHPRLEPAFRKPDPAHDGPDPGHELSHTLDIPARDKTGDLVPTPPEPAQLSNLAGAAQWPSEQWASEMPQSHDDALHILGMGVTAKASLPAMKKIVDGLRQSWHPDQATDDADRAIRDLRIRQINTAWDVLTASQANSDSQARQDSHASDPVI